MRRVAESLFSRPCRSGRFNLQADAVDAFYGIFPHKLFDDEGIGAGLLKVGIFLNGHI
jgi:hypothetical protein